MFEHYISDFDRIKKYINQAYRRPTRYTTRAHYFEAKSYKAWAAQELLDYIQENRELTLVDAIQDFVDMMDFFSTRKTFSSSTWYMFSIARDVGLDVLDHALTL